MTGEGPFWMAIGLMAGYVCGVASLGMLYLAFKANEERRAAIKMQRLQNQARMKDEQVEATKRKLLAQYGADLNKNHQEVIDEEVERILGVGPVGKGGK